MINSSPKGAATLFVAVTLLVLSTLIIIFAGNFGIMEEKATANYVQNSQAFNAADAGIEFAINYLKQNAATVLAGPVSGFISYSDASTTNIALTNGSKFSVVYTNPVANNYNLIKITSTGVSANSNSTRVLTQLVQWGSILASPGTTPLVTQGSVSMAGNSNITNTNSNQTILSGSTVSLGGSSSTTLSSGTSSTAGNIKSDIQTSNSNLSGMSLSDFFATYFGNTASNIESAMAHVYTNSSSTNYSSTLNGMTGTSVWIDQTGGTTATINGNTTIGSASNPVLLIVNGDLSLSGNVTIYGYIFVFGTNTIDSITGNVNIIGGLAASGNLSMAGNSNLSMSTSVLSNLQNGSSMKYYAKVPGSWRDF